MRKYLALGVAVLAISACSDKGADADGDGKVSNDEAKAELSSGGSMAMKPGQWEMKISFTDIQAAGLPPGTADKIKEEMGKGVAQRSCFTKEQVEKPGADFFGGAPEANCSFEELNRSGNSMKVAMTCKPDETMTIKMKMDGTFAAESYSMKIDQSTEGPPTGAMKMSGTIEGKRIGDCPA